MDEMAHQLSNLSLINKKRKNRHPLGMQLEKDVSGRESAPSANNRDTALLDAIVIRTGTHFVAVVTSMGFQVLISGRTDVGVDRSNEQKLETLGHHRKFAKETKIGCNSSPKTS